MKICRTIEEMRAECRHAKSGGKRLGLVPTMGALHEGHLSLIRAAKNASDLVAVSIFVNPTQFGPTEDLTKYPRSFERDCELLEGEGVQLTFAPSVEEMYPGGAVTWITVEGVSGRLDGRSRPGHFRGVATIVAKLLNVVEPDAAFFGQKDAAQVAVVRRMVRDLDMPVEIVACPIVREEDGLAMSSRNIYLSAQERERAKVLYRALATAKKLWDAGERNVEKLLIAGRDVIAGEELVRLDYLDVVDAETLEHLERADEGAVMAVAAWVGNTRLIDNLVLGKKFA